MSTDTLNPSQSHALLDILSHHEVYQEIQDFKDPSALTGYGPPFDTKPGQPSTSPSLQGLVSRFLLRLPGLKDAPKAFWHEQCATIIADLEKAELSESYDKGLIGIRKTLATAISALVEYPVRGVFAGFKVPEEHDPNQKYDRSKAEDLQRAFSDLMHQCVYGDMLDHLFKKCAETDKLEDHTDLVRAAHEYIIINLASFMHYTLILSPKGQNLIALIDNANKLVPYGIIKQTLKIGNVASMISAMVKVVLAKVSMATVTNWIGITKGHDEGQNLMQHIISQVLQWDVRDLKSRASKIEKDKSPPSKEQTSALHGYLDLSRSDHSKLRQQSQSQSKSLPQVILSNAKVSTQLTDVQHNLAQDYLAIQLSIRDREQIVKVFCKSNPDHLTTGVRTLVDAYEPMIRKLHEAVDLSATLSDFEVFLKDLIKLSKIPDANSKSAKGWKTPTVGDFIELLHKHQGASHRFIHQCGKNGPELMSWFHDYLNAAAAEFRRKDTSSPTTDNDAGDLTKPLNDLFSKLPSEQQAEYKPLLDQHAAYLQALHTSSLSRLRSVLSSPRTNHPALQSTSRPSSATSSPANTTSSNSATSALSSVFSRSSNSDTASQPGTSSAASSRASSPGPGSGGASTIESHAAAQAAREAHPGPGAYLARWQALIEATAITPASAEGPVRRGGSGSVLRASRTGGVEAEEAAGIASAGKGGQSGKGKGEEEEEEELFEDAMEKLSVDDGSGKVARPDTSRVVEALEKGFREMLGKRACTW